MCVCVRARARARVCVVVFSYWCMFVDVRMLCVPVFLCAVCCVLRAAPGVMCPVFFYQTCKVSVFLINEFGSVIYIFHPLLFLLELQIFIMILYC